MLRDKAARIWCWSVAGMWRITQPGDRRAVTAIEYAIIAGVLAAVIVVSVTAPAGGGLPPPLWLF